MTIKNFQREMKEWFSALPQVEQETLRQKYVAANPHKKDFNFEVDGNRGSTTKFFEQEMPKEKQPAKTPETKGLLPAVPSSEEIVAKGDEVAKFMTANGMKKKDGSDYTCKACVVFEEDKKQLTDAAALMARENRPDLQGLLMGLRPKDSSALGAAYVAEKIKSPQTLEMPAQETSMWDVKGFAALDISNKGIQPIGQAMLTNNTIFLGVSQRPNNDLFVTAANITKTSKNEKFISEFGIPKVSIGRTDANTEGENACGCSGNAPPGKLATGLGLNRKIDETAVAGGAVTLQGDKGKMRVLAGAVTQSDVFEPGKAAAIIEERYKVTEKTALVGNVAASENQTYAAVGAQKWIHDDSVQVKANVSSARGNKNFDAVSATTIFYINGEWTAAASAGAVKDRDIGKTSPEASVAVTRKIGKNGFGEAFVATELPEKKKDGVGVTAGVRFGFKF